MRRTVVETTWVGVGIHTGQPCRVTVRPTPPGRGIHIGGVPVDVLHMVYSVNSSGMPGARTIEHLMAALRMAGVDDAELQVEGGEIPALDGSAAPFLDALCTIEAPGEPPAPLVLTEPVEVRLAGAGCVVASPAPELLIAVEIDFPEFGAQRYAALGEHARDAAAARTFTTRRLLNDLQTRGHGLGVSVDNALVVDEQGRWNVPLRYPDEPVRHKWLDLYGDLALLGRPVVARIDAVRPSHALNHELVDALRRHACAA